MEMYKKIIFAILLCFAGKAYAQPSQYTPMTANGYQMKRVKVDSTLHIPSFCGVPTLSGSTSIMGAIAYDTCNNILYKYNHADGWTEVSTDTSSLSSRINDKIDSLIKSNDSVFAYKNGTAYFQFKDSSGGGGSTSTLLALPFTTDHISATNNQYVVGDVVWYLGNVYRCLANNDAILPTSTIYWLNLGPGYPLVQQPADWSSTSGNNQILNKPTILTPTDTVSLSNRINDKIDSLKRSTDSVFAYKNGTAYFQYKDSIGGGSTSAANDTAKVVIAKVHNATGTILQRGEVVYLSGANGDVASVKRANNKQDSTSSKTFGIVRRDIAIGDTGYITTQGQIEKLNLGAYNPGDILWLDSIDGQFTKSIPQAPYHSVFLGVVERANNGNGLMYVKPQNGYELGELHDVQMNGKVNNQILVYSDTQKVWKNRSVYTIVDTTSLSSRINAKYSTADTNKLQQKSLPAYSIMGNNTNAAANPTAVYYKDTAGTYTGTITFTATTAPSGTTNHSYRWTRIGNLVTLNITLVYSVAGGTVSQVILTIPSDAPTPAKPAGLTSASNTTYPVLYQYSGNISSQPGNAAQRAIMRTNAANNGSEIVSLNTGTTITVFYYTVQYTAQ